MIEAKLFLCADSAAIDARINAVSAFHIMELLNAPSFPVAIPRISVIVLLGREQTDPSSIQFQLQVHLGDQQLYAGPMPVNFIHQLSARTIVDMHGLVVPAPGLLRFILRNGEQTVSSWTITINQVGQPGVQMYLPTTQPPPAGQVH